MKSGTGVPCESVIVPLISATLSVKTIATSEIVWPLRTAIGVSVTSRPSIVTDFSAQPRMLPFGRIR